MRIKYRYQQDATLLKNHWDEILNYFDYRYTNAILEGMNSIIQNIKRRARGFRNDEYFKTMIYLGCGKLDLNILCELENLGNLNENWQSSVLR